MLKRCVDVVVSAGALLLLVPAMALIGLAVRASSPGPVLFRQKRLGAGGRPFTLLKFRTMYVDAREIRAPDGSALTTENDPRITRIGRLLRSTSLDELPQLVNVLRGDMSLVGPRPDQADQIVFYTEEERCKLTVKPGLTGLAQISGRNRISWHERKALDVQYVRQRSFRLDAAILVKTVPYVLFRKDVHHPTMQMARPLRNACRED